MKKTMNTLLAVVLLLSLTTGAFAAPGVDITTTITPTSTLAAPINVDQGQTQLLTATTVLTNENGNASFQSESWVGAAVQTPASGTSANTFTSTALFSAVGKAPGPYTVTYNITLQRGGGQGIVTGTDSDVAYIEVVEVTQVIFVAPMAAPAIAAHILQFNNVKASYKTGKLAGNFIADVAQHMGPGTAFDGVPKAIEEGGEQVSNPAYRQAVLDFLNAHLKMTKTLLMPSF